MAWYLPSSSAFSSIGILAFSSKVPRVHKRDCRAPMALQIGMVCTRPNSANVLRIVSVFLRDVNKLFTDYLQSATHMVCLHL